MGLRGLDVDATEPTRPRWRRTITSRTHALALVGWQWSQLGLARDDVRSSPVVEPTVDHELAQPLPKITVCQASSGTRCGHQAMAEIEIASRHFLPGRASAIAQRDNEALEREGRTDYHYGVRRAVRGPFRWYVVLEDGDSPAYWTESSSSRRRWQGA